MQHRTQRCCLLCLWNPNFPKVQGSFNLEKEWSAPVKAMVHEATPVTPQGGCRIKISAWPAGIISASSSCFTEYISYLARDRESPALLTVGKLHRLSSTYSVGPFAVTATNFINCCLTCTADGLSLDKIRSGWQWNSSNKEGHKCPKVQ